MLYFQLMLMRVNSLFHLSVGVVQRQILLKLEMLLLDVLIPHISVVWSLLVVHDNHTTERTHYGLKSAVDFLIVFHEADDNARQKYFAQPPHDWASVHSGFDTKPKALLSHLSLALNPIQLEEWH